MRKSKLKPVNIRNPKELRKSLQEASNLSRLSGGKGDTPEHIERIIYLHCSKNLSLESSILQASEETYGKGTTSKFRKRAENILKERENRS